MTGVQRRLRFSSSNTISLIRVTRSSTTIASIYKSCTTRKMLLAVLVWSPCVPLFFCLYASAKGGVRLGTSDTRLGDQSQMLATELKTEHLKEPLGIETPLPRFSWLLVSGERGQLQTGFQVLVASSLNNLQADKSDKWDSGKVSADNSVEVVYAGSELARGERCYWKGRVWNRSGKPGVYSSPSFFEMGLRKLSDWKGKWIAARKGVSSPIFRRAISIDKPVERARIYVSGIGYYELFINGKRVGDRVLDPASTYYNNDQPFKLSTRVLYATYDVIQYLQAGSNAIGVMLGNGWYSAEADVAPSPAGRSPYGDRPRLILQMNVELEGGQSINLVSDSNWKTSAGPITYSDLFNGETYDARLEQSG